MIDQGRLRGPIKGHVAKVLSSREIVINRGARDGVTGGMRFAVLDPKAEDIRDPQSNEVLGSIYRPKAEVEVVKVEEKLSLARTFKKRRVNVGGSGGFGLGLDPKMFMAPRYETQFETFKTADAAWEDITESESIVKTGDSVEQVIYLSPDEANAAASTRDTD